MQVFGLLFFIAVWLIILWIGFIALEATCMERARARFQALSALSGTGFTTSHAEAVVNHPRRRRIVSYLMFLGNTGIIALLLLVIFYAHAGIAPPSTATIVISVVILLAIGLAIWFRLVDKLTTAILRLIGKERIIPLRIAQKILYQTGDYALVRLDINKESSIIGLNIKEAVLRQQPITILAIERGYTVLFQPEIEEKLMAGDNLLCYGKLASIGAIIEK